MTYSKTIIALFILASFSQFSVAEPGGILSNVTPDILVGGLNIESGNHTGPILNGSSMVHAKNARSYNSGLCTFKVSFSIYNDSGVKPGQFVTTMSYNEHPNVINDYTVLSAANIKTYQWLVQLKPGKNTIRVHADQQNDIQETNELNNRLTKRVIVIGQCGEQNKPLTPAVNKNIAPVKPTASQIKPQLPAGELAGKINIAPQQAKQDCRYDPNDARLPCRRKPTIKLINPFE